MAKKDDGEPGSGLDLGEVSRLSRALVEAEDSVAAAEDGLKALKERERRLREEDLPTAMEELGLESLKLSTGEKITTKLEVYASIPVAQRGDAYRWLEEHGYGGLIKTEIDVSFGREQLQEAKAMLESLRDAGMEANMTNKIEPQTLKAWLKEQLAAAESVPLDLFGARPVTQAKVTRAKSK